MIAVQGGQAPFGDDTGSADRAVAAALAAFAAGAGSEHQALTALAASRLLVPLVANPGAASHAEMSVPTLVGHDGRRALLAFTCLDAMARWRPDARPVPETASSVWNAAVADGAAVVVDVAGPVPVAVDGARLDALAEGRPVPLPHQDPDVQAAVRAAAAARQAIARIDLAPGEDDSDMVVQVTLAAGSSRATAQDDVRLLGSELMESLGGRLRRGIAVAASQAAAAGSSGPSGRRRGGSRGAASRG